MRKDKPKLFNHMVKSQPKQIPPNSLNLPSLANNPLNLVNIKRTLRENPFKTPKGPRPRPRPRRKKKKFRYRYRLNAQLVAQLGGTEGAWCGDREVGWCAEKDWEEDEEVGGPLNVSVWVMTVTIGSSRNEKSELRIFQKADAERRIKQINPLDQPVYQRKYLVVQKRTPRPNFHSNIALQQCHSLRLISLLPYKNPVPKSTQPSPENPPHFQAS